MNNANITGKNRLSDLLASYAATETGDRVTLGDIVQLLGNRSIGGLLLVLALPMALPVPAPGISAVFGIPLIFVSAQLILGRRQAWLPQTLASRSIPRDRFVEIIKRILPVLQRLEQVVKPRAVWLCGRWATIPIGIVSVILAAIITLPVPFGNVVPGMAVALFALGLVEHDGWAIAFGLVTSVLAVIIILAALFGVHYLAQLW